MFYVQNGIFCCVCYKSYITNNYQNPSKDEAFVNNDLRNHCSTSMIVKNVLSKEFENRTC